DRGHHDRRPRRRGELGSDQGGRAGSQRAGREVQSASAHRGGAGRRGGVHRPGSLPALQGLTRHDRGEGERMARSSAPPSRSPGATRTVDVRGWLGGIRLSGFMVIMLGLVVLAAFVLMPTLGTYIDLQQRIAALEQSVRATEAEVATLEKERERWNDPAFITTQARERLYYVRPGEVVYLVDNDLDADEMPREQEPVSDELTARESDWMSQILRSVTSAGLARTAVAPSG